MLPSSASGRHSSSPTGEPQRGERAEQPGEHGEHEGGPQGHEQVGRQVAERPQDLGDDRRVEERVDVAGRDAVQRVRPGRPVGVRVEADRGGHHEDVVVADEHDGHDREGMRDQPARGVGSLPGTVDRQVHRRNCGRSAGRAAGRGGTGGWRDLPPVGTGAASWRRCRTVDLRRATTGDGRVEGHGRHGRRDRSVPRPAGGPDGGPRGRSRPPTGRWRGASIRTSRPTARRPSGWPPSTPPST